MKADPYNDFKADALMSTLPDIWPYGVSARTSGLVSMFCDWDETASLICIFSGW